MPTENEVFIKIKEISTRTVQPRPLVNTGELAKELSVTREKLMPSLDELKSLRLVNFNDPEVTGIRLTLLGSIVNRKVK
jgi:predicted transcriptional regulator